MMVRNDLGIVRLKETQDLCCIHNIEAITCHQKHLGPVGNSCELELWKHVVPGFFS